MMSSSTNTVATATAVLLSKRINDATKEVHETSGNSINWKLSLILTSRECYCEAISLFWIVYREIERLFQKHSTTTNNNNNNNKALQLLQPFAAVFERASKIEGDIRYLMPSSDAAEALLQRRWCRGGGDNKKKDTYDPPALQDYVDRLERIAAENPGTARGK